METRIVSENLDGPLRITLYLSKKVKNAGYCYGILPLTPDMEKEEQVLSINELVNTFFGFIRLIPEAIKEETRPGPMSNENHLIVAGPSFVSDTIYLSPEEFVYIFSHPEILKNPSHEITKKIPEYKLKTFFIGLFLILIGFLVLGIIWLKSVYFIFISLNKNLKWKVDKRARIEFARSLSEIAYPGWRVKVDDRKAEMKTVAGILRGVELPAEAHEVEFFFRPLSVYIGLALFGVGLIGLSEMLIITEYGKPIGRIVPETDSIEERLQAMVDAGLLLWAGEKPEVGEPAGVNRGSRMISELVEEDRDVDYLSRH